MKAQFRPSLILLTTLLLVTSGHLFGMPVYAAKTPTIYISPASQPLATAGSTVTYNVNVSNISPVTMTSPGAPVYGWSIYVDTNDSVLTPVSVKLGSVLPDALTTILCINSVAQPGTQGCDINDGPGVVHYEVYSLAGSGSTANGTLFTISYAAKVNSNCSTCYSLVTLPVVQLTTGALTPALYDQGGNSIPEASPVAGAYGNVPQLPVAIFSWAPLQPFAGDRVNFTATNSITPPGTRLTSYDWTLASPVGILSFASGVNISRVFGPTDTGVWTITVAVRNDQGTFSLPNSQTLKVVPPPPPCKSGLQYVPVPGGCPTIGSAIDSVLPMGTIEVSPGTYQEDLSISKPVNLVGAGNGLSVIEGSVFIDDAPGVRVGGFTIISSEFSNTAIVLNHSRGGSLANNTIMTTAFTVALVVTSSDGVIVSNNTLTGSRSGGGILLEDSTGAMVENNRISSESTGFAIVSSPESVLRTNIMTNNVFSFDVSGVSLGDYVENIDTSNTIDGRPIYYFQNVRNPSVPPNAGYLGFVNVQDLTLGPRSITGAIEEILLAGSTNATVNGLITKTVIVVSSNNVSIENLVALGAVVINNSTTVTLEQSSVGNKTPGDTSCSHVGIYLSGSREIRILNNTISGCDIGLVLDNSDSNEISQNFFASAPPNALTGFGYGIIVRGSTGNEFVDNRLLNYTQQGIGLESSPANIFERNVLEGSPGIILTVGISLFNSPRNTLRNNAFPTMASITVRSNHPDCSNSGNPCALVEDYVQYVDPSNTVGGRPVYYLVDRNHYTIPSDAGFVVVVNSTQILIQGVNLSFHDPYLAGDIMVVSSTNVTIEKANLTFSLYGIWAWLTIGLTVEQSNFSGRSNEGAAIRVFDSNEGLISGNNIVTFHTYDGINISGSDFTIQGNYVTNYDFEGIEIFGSNNTLYRNTIVGTFQTIFGPNGVFLRGQGNLFVGNTIANNIEGLDAEPGNKIYLNNFLGNRYQAAGMGNIWDNGAGQGNYWSDYNGQDTDGDGVGDTLLPYLGLDNYPLMSPWSPQGLSAQFTGRAAWPEHQRFVASRDDDGLQTLFARTVDNGTASEWVDAVFNITSADGTTLTLVSAPVWVAPGAPVTLPVTLEPSSGVYSVTVELRFSSDAYLTWTVAGTHSFTFRVAS